MSLFQRRPFREVPLYNAPNVKWSIGVLHWQFVWQKKTVLMDTSTTDFVMLFDKLLLGKLIEVDWSWLKTQTVGRKCVFPPTIFTVCVFDQLQSAFLLLDCWNICRSAHTYIVGLSYVLRLLSMTYCTDVWRSLEITKVRLCMIIRISWVCCHLYCYECAAQV